MKSETITVQQVFQDRRQYRVPFYQRTYVWNKEDQWERLWQDIQEKASQRLENTIATPISHFIGAVVLAPQPRRGILGIEELSVIDGQQRLTTLQYILSSIAILLEEHDQSALLSLVNSCRWNSNPETMDNPDTDRFKLWPTFRDRQAYKSATSVNTIKELKGIYSVEYKPNKTDKKNNQFIHLMQSSSSIRK